MAKFNYVDFKLIAYRYPKNQKVVSKPEITFNGKASI